MGLEVRQSYLEEISVYLKPFSYSDSKIRLTSFSKKFDSNKQLRAFMPNLIHSLDAASLTHLLKKYFSNPEFNNKSIYTIHDCFAMPMNHIEFIIDSLRKVYISLYSENAYLTKLDSGILQHIENHYGPIVVNREKNLLTVKINDTPKNFEYPDIKTVLGNDLPILDTNIPYIIK